VTANGTSAPASIRIRAAVVWGLLYAALWALLGQGQGWSFGVPLIVAAVLLSDHLQLYPARLRLQRVLPFVAFFLHRLLRGGIDVSLRTLRKTPAQHAGWVTYHFSPHASSDVRLLMSTVTGMLPGTLAARIDDDIMHMHILDTSMDWEGEAGRLEQQLLRLIDSGASS